MAQSLAVGKSAAMIRTTSAWIEMFDGGFDPSKLVAVHAHCLEQMRAAFLLDVMTLANAGGGGSYNLGQVLTNAFTALVGRIAGRIEEVMNGQAPFQGALFACLSHSYGAIDPADLPVLCIDGLREAPFADLLPLLVNMLATGAPATAPREWAAAASASHFDRRDIEVIVAEARALAAGGEAAPAQGMRLPNLDPGAGGVPVAPNRMARIQEHYGPGADVEAAAEEPVNLASYTGTNADVAMALNLRMGQVGTLVQRARALGIETPTIGAAHGRRWDMTRLTDWYDAVYQGRPAEEAA